MRVAVNQLEALKQKTGIGHYTDQLLRCLSRQIGTGEVEVYPSGWSARLCKALLARKARHDAQAGGHFSSRGDPSFVGRIRGWAGQRARSYSQAMLARHFAHACAKRRYDLYHEPNMIPLPSDCPTIITVHDLSLLLYPEWHPADRVRYFERRFFAGLAQCRHFLTVSD
ncbi:MAG TPA: hypothetical protein VFA18_08360, partial [Gemmataceae bacterium]|nr:hypothetical protein [Gemmataceae bacterium]